MAIIGKELPEFSLQGFRNPDVVTVTKADVVGKWSVFVFYPAHC